MDALEGRQRATEEGHEGLFALHGAGASAPVKSTVPYSHLPPWAAGFLAVLCSVIGSVGCVFSGSHQDAKMTQDVSGGPAVTSPPHMRLLSQDQYFNSIGYIFGADIHVPAHFAPFRRIQGLLEVGAASAGVTTGQAEEFQRTAVALANEIVGPEHRGFLVPCTPKHATGADNACATEFLSSVGRLLYRRPLSRGELTSIVDKADEAATRMQDFYAGLSVALEGMLIAPEVLFAVDKSEPDPHHPGRSRLEAYSLATRLSLFLWNAAPDDELLHEAQRGQLYSVAGRARAVDRMLASPRLETGVRAFFADMLGFDALAALAKDSAIYPAFSGATVQDAREQTLRTIVNHLLVKKGDYRDLFTTRDTYLTPALAVLYRLPAPPGWSEYEFPASSHRAGLLTQVSFLAAHSHPGRSSPTLRGKALRELLLCQNVPRPPPNVDFSKLENPDPTLKTMRQRLTAHRQNPVCAGCHRITDPIGLALENFDGAGQYRETERGATIDASGSLDGRDFTSPDGLAQALHDDPALPACLVQRLYSYAVGNSEKGGAQSVLSYLNQSFAAADYRLPALMRTISLSNAFTEVGTPASPDPALPQR